MNTAPFKGEIRPGQIWMMTKRPGRLVRVVGFEPGYEWRWVNGKKVRIQLGAERVRITTVMPLPDELAVTFDSLLEIPFFEKNFTFKIQPRE